MDDQKVNLTNEKSNKAHKHQKETKKLKESVNATAPSNSLDSTVLEEKDQFNSGIDLNK